MSVVFTQLAAEWRSVWLGLQRSKWVRQPSYTGYIIITYPPNIDNLFVICVQLDYSIGLHVYTKLTTLLNITAHSSSARCKLTYSSPVHPRPCPIRSTSTTSIEQTYTCTYMAARIHEASSRLVSNWAYTQSLSAQRVELIAKYYVRINSNFPLVAPPQLIIIYNCTHYI